MKSIAVKARLAIDERNMDVVPKGKPNYYGDEEEEEEEDIPEELDPSEKVYVFFLNHNPTADDVFLDREETEKNEQFFLLSGYCLFSANLKKGINDLEHLT